MRMVTSEYRLVLTPSDREFIHAILDPQGDQTDALDALLFDPESVTSLLDDPRLYDSVMDQALTLDISSHLFFYIVLRRELSELNLKSSKIPEYLSWSLKEFSMDHPLWNKNSSELQTHFLNAVDFMELVKSVDSYQKFLLELWAGNYYLIWSGLFHDFLERRETRSGAPGVKFYEKLGLSSFHFAQNHPLAQEFEMNHILDEIVDEYYTVRRALTRVSDEILVWN